jgi:hypothetical protein
MTKNQLKTALVIIAIVALGLGIFIGRYLLK